MRYVTKAPRFSPTVWLKASPLYAERRQCKYEFLSDYIRCVVVFPNQLEDGTWRQASSSYESGERERESVIMLFFSICTNKGKIRDVLVCLTFLQCLQLVTKKQHMHVSTWVARDYHTHSIIMPLTSPTVVARSSTICWCDVATTLSPLISIILWPTRTPPLSAILPRIRLQI